MVQRDMREVVVVDAQTGLLGKVGAHVADPTRRRDSSGILKDTSLDDRCLHLVNERRNIQSQVIHDAMP